MTWRPESNKSARPAHANPAARVTVAFDPWASSAEDALRARAQIAAGAPDPLTQQEAARTITALRDAFDGDAGGCSVLEAVKLCLLHQLAAPQWLTDAFASRYASVTEAAVRSWSDPQAFGEYWPAGTHLAAERKRRRQQRAIYAEVWRLVTTDPERKVNHDLFEEVGEQRAISCSGSQADRLYYAYLAEGMPNPLDARGCLMGEAAAPSALAESPIL
ncbi:hypothetical protein [Variovorax sp. dw_308]|uniref:hypothetical protein n=1 Tax=Variovorax sp. dw_308 TaxID=2721546 RepID=UPI001C473375|nr:hypothetical protein [Variovorax sp. dw_308]